jgi:hypothetical protein
VEILSQRLFGVVCKGPLTGTQVIFFLF